MNDHTHEPQELDGSPILLDDCECGLPIAELTNCIKFSQFVVLPSTTGGKAKYERAKLPVAKLFDMTVAEFAKNVADRWVKEWQRMLSEDASRRSRQRTPRGAVSGLRRFPGFRAPKSADGIDQARERLIARITARFEPGDFVAWHSKHPLIGICAIFEQCWQLAGYTRGELVSSISLAPGEQVVLEYHIWDKSTLKSEEELAEELELRLSSKLTRRDSQELVSELSTQSGVKLSENLNFTIPIPLGDAVLPIGVAVGGELTQQLNSKLNGTLTSVTERTEEAATLLRNQHKVRVEVARETGRESKQTRTIANTNRCHTLTCHYFEILSNYRIVTRLKRIAPCVLVRIPGFVVTPAWVLCHEDILRKVLLDPVFLPGFDAAKLLETASALAVIAPAASASPERPAEAGGEGGVLNDLRASILESWDELQDAADDMVDAVQDLLAFDLDGIEVLKETIFKGFYLAILAANQDAYKAIEKLDSSRESVDGLEGLRRMFASVSHRDYQYTVVKSAIAEGLDALGVPDDVVDFLLLIGNLSPIIGVQSFAEFIADDAGLHVAVKAAEDRVKALTGSPAGDIAAGIAGAGTLTPGLLPAVSVRGAPGAAPPISALSLAEAQVEFARLKCHIQDYKTHYTQALWLHMHPDERSVFLADAGIASSITGELLGFVDTKAAYALSDAKLFRPDADIDELLKKIAQGINRQPASTIQLPTGGATLEAHLGCCDACEDFIQESREAELRTVNARADQEEAEAERRHARLAGDPQDLADFVTPQGGTINVRVESTAPDAGT